MTKESLAETAKIQIKRRGDRGDSGKGKEERGSGDEDVAEEESRQRKEKGEVAVTEIRRRKERELSVTRRFSGDTRAA